jgi:phosphonate transport system substrate-binding protein
MAILLGVITGAPSAARAGCEDPAVLRVSGVPTEKLGSLENAYAVLGEVLQVHTGKKVNYVSHADYFDTVQGLLEHRIDVAILGPYSYIKARESDSSIEVFGTYSKRGGEIHEGGPGYRSVLITRKREGEDRWTIEKLRGAKLGLTNVGSTSGNFLPRTIFAEFIEAKLEEYFGEVHFTGAHDLSIAAVYAGFLDAAFVGDYHIDNVISRGRITKDDFEVLWRSPRIPHDPFVYRGGLCPDLKAKIRHAILDSSGDPKMKTFLDLTNSNAIVSMEASDYDILDRLKAERRPLMAPSGAATKGK